MSVPFIQARDPLGDALRQAFSNFGQGVTEGYRESQQQTVLDNVLRNSMVDGEIDPTRMTFGLTRSGAFSPQEVQNTVKPYRELLAKKGDAAERARKARNEERSLNQRDRALDQAEERLRQNREKPDFSLGNELSLIKQEQDNFLKEHIIKDPFGLTKEEEEHNKEVYETARQRFRKARISAFKERGLKIPRSLRMGKKEKFNKNNKEHMELRQQLIEEANGDNELFVESMEEFFER